MTYKSEEPCVGCSYFLENEVCYHHVQSRKAGGGDEPENLMSLCKKCHVDIHMGLGSFIARYPHVEQWLIDNGREDILEKVKR